MVDDLVKGPGALAHAYLTRVGHGDPYVAVTGLFWSSFFLMALAIYAITQVSRWTADDQEGRLETVLSAPISRSRVVLERAVTFLVATTVVVAASSSALFVALHANNIEVHASDLLNASWPLLPFALSFAAVGALLATRVPRAAAAVLGTVAFLGYVITLGGPFLKWPDWTLKLSVFSLYGNPLFAGVYWDGFWILAAVTVIGFGLGALLMNRREIGA
jgi:ABC-2 type transport system permease protein